MAVGAAYAKSVYREKVKKIAIVDFDVHHGNGTEAIMKNLKPHSLKQDFTTFEGCKLEVSSDEYMPWLDEKDFENVLFISS